MTKLLSLPDKRRFLELIIQRDGGMRCLYCKKLLTIRTAVFEHLNGKNNDNRLDNLALACQSCNIKKINDSHLDELAWFKLEMNEKGIFVGEKFFGKLKPNGHIEPNEASTEIDINVTNFDITEKFISEVVDTNGFILYSDALNSSVCLCKKKTSHGSQQSVRNYLATLTSSVGPFEITRNENKKKIIVNRVSK